MATRRGCYKLCFKVQHSQAKSMSATSWNGAKLNEFCKCIFMRDLPIQIGHSQQHNPRQASRSRRRLVVAASGFYRAILCGVTQTQSIAAFTALLPKNMIVWANAKKQIRRCCEHAPVLQAPFRHCYVNDLKMCSILSWSTPNQRSKHTSGECVAYALSGRFRGSCTSASWWAAILWSPSVPCGVCSFWGCGCTP